MLQKRSSESIGKHPEFEQAILLATAVHAGQFKYKTGIPYIAHVLNVCRMVSLCTKDHEILVAALLHDAVEKGGVTPEGIAQKFGKRVAELVGAMAEPAKGRWKQKKTALLETLNSSEDEGLLLIACADKADNVQTLLMMKAMGVTGWTRKAGASEEDLLWYHESAFELFSQKKIFRDKSASALLTLYGSWFRELSSGEKRTDI